MKRRWLSLGIVIVIAIVAVYLGSPYLAVRSFKDAAQSANVDQLDAAVDFPAVRESLKSQMSAALMHEMRNDPELKDNPFSGLGVLMMPAILDKMVDTFVTPDGIAAMVKGGRPASSGAEPQGTNPDVDYDYDYVSLDRFRVKIANPKSGEAGPSLVFERRGIISWKLIRIELPADFLKNSDQTAAVPKQPPTFVPPVGLPPTQ